MKALKERLSELEKELTPVWRHMRTIATNAFTGTKCREYT